MAKLLRSGMRRYAHSIIFWLAALVNVGAGVYSGYWARNYYAEDMGTIITLITNAVMISWLVGREYEEGIFRNKVIAGHTKGKVFLSELILGVGACIAFYMISVLIFLCFNSYIFGHAPVGFSVKMFIDCLLATSCFATIFVTISCLTSRRAIVGVINILLVLGTMFAGYAIEDRLDQPESWTECEYEQVQFTDSEGNVHMSMEPIEGTEHEVKNDRYVDGFARDVLQAMYRVLPFGKFEDSVMNTGYWFGYDAYRISDTPDVEASWESEANFTVTEEMVHSANWNLIYSVVELIVLCGIGYLCFRKKELK